MCIPALSNLHPVTAVSASEGSSVSFMQWAEDCSTAISCIKVVTVCTDTVETLALDAVWERKQHNLGICRLHNIRFLVWEQGWYITLGSLCLSAWNPVWDAHIFAPLINTVYLKCHMCILYIHPRVFFVSLTPSFSLLLSLYHRAIWIVTVFIFSHGVWLSHFFCSSHDNECAPPTNITCCVTLLIFVVSGSAYRL